MKQIFHSAFALCASAPSAPPTRLEATLINGSTALVKWSPPPASFQNGPLQSYQVPYRRTVCPRPATVRACSLFAHFLATAAPDWVGFGCCRWSCRPATPRGW